MNTQRATRRLLLYEGAGFLILIAVSWLNELVSLPRVLFAIPHHGKWQEALLETFVILMVAIPSLFLTHRLLGRLFYVEGFLQVCGWCHRINVDGEWLPLENYLSTKLHRKTTHGICGDCTTKYRTQMHTHPVVP